MKILVLTESIAGSGHTIAAQNIAKGIHQLYPDAHIKIDTSLPKVSPLLERCASELYMRTIRHASPLWGWAYEREKQWSLLCKNLLQRFIAKRLRDYVQKERPEIIVSTHAFCLGGLAALKKTCDFPFLLGAALTDYGVNSFWVFDEIDCYFVGDVTIQEKMIEQYNIQKEKIHVTGIPVDPYFFSQDQQVTIREKYGIPSDFKIVLVTGGGCGFAPYKEILAALNMVSIPLYIVVVLGVNPVKEDVCKLAQHISHQILVLDYVTNMVEWMMAANLMIGKPGGLTVSETMACGLPMMIYKPIPGQEERNSQFLLSNHMALRADNPEELIEKVEAYFMDDVQGQELRERIHLLSKPEAAFHVGKILLSQVNNFH